MQKQILIIIVILLSYTLYGQKNNNVFPNRKLTHNNQPSNQGNQSQDTVPIVKAIDKISNNAVIKLPHVVSIPAEAFRASNENGNNGYYKIRRDGLGTLAGTGETINNSLVAPLQLPDGAVISRIHFNILSLYSYKYFPHLKLVQRGMVKSDRQEGAYLFNAPVNKYSITSFALSTVSGLLDIKTLVADKMDYKINNKSSSYFLEVMANKSDQPPTDVRHSHWPNDNYLFIWSVEVYYTIN